MNYVSQDSPGRDRNRAPPEYKSRSFSLDHPARLCRRVCHLYICILFKGAVNSDYIAWDGWTIVNNEFGNDVEVIMA
jgi:hypothetical protein